MSEGKFAHGAKLSLGGTDIGELTNISGPDRSREEAEVTSHDSGGGDEWVGGLRRGGSVTFSGILAMGTEGDAGQDALVTNYNADGGDEVEEVIVTLPDNAGATATTYTFNGFVTQPPNIDLPHDGPGTFEATIKLAKPDVTIAKASAT